MSSTPRLKYKIVKCTSEDPEFPSSELLVHSPQTKGWQTARFCDFPQEVVLQFETPVHLRQVQFLSHQSKIATKIELFTSLPASGTEARCDTTQFKRLGYLSLDSNERSQFQARELKSVYVDVSAQFLRILFHKCHVNKYNIVNQVGIIALNCLGEALGPDLAVGPPPPNPALARGNTPAAPAQTRQQPTPLHSPSAQQQQQQPQQQERQRQEAPAAAIPALAAPAKDPDEGKYDERTLEKIRNLNLAKDRAVEAEDYEEAKRCKEMVVRLRQIGQSLRDLEERKRQAVQNEDYDVAKALKAEIDNLRQQAERPESRPESRAANNTGPPRWPTAGVAEAQQPHPAAPAPRRFASPPASEAPSATHGSRAASGGAPSLGNAEQEDIDTEHFPTGGGSRVARTPPPPQMRGPQSQSAMGPTALPAREAPEPMVAQEPNMDHPLGGVPGAEDLQVPEPLPHGVADEAATLITLFGDYVVRCIYSKAWSLKDAALQKLALDLDAGVHDGADPAQLLGGYTAVLGRTIADKSVQVFRSSAALLQAVRRKLLEAYGMRRNDAQASLDQLMPLLVERVGDANARVDSHARDVLLELAHTAAVGAPFAVQHVLRPPKKKAVPPRVYSSRLAILTGLVTDVGVQPDSPEGLPLDPMAKLAMEWYGNAASDVRESAVRLMAACYARVGLGRIDKFLANLRPAQREVFEAEFQKVDGANDGQQHFNAGVQQTLQPATAHEELAQDEEVSATTCQFCGMHDPAFTGESMDLHYWRECPMLTQCEHCQQVVEISSLRSHLCEECESGAPALAAARNIAPGCCPLCGVGMGHGREEDWREHLLSCSKNPRVNV